LSLGLWGYDAALAFVAVYAVICSDRKQRLLLAGVAAAVAAIMHGAFKVWRVPCNCIAMTIAIAIVSQKPTCLL
jgi:hypothetical protein